MRRRSRGYTLVECLVVMVLLGLTMTAVTAVLHTMYQSDRRLRDALSGQRTLEELAAQLRQDAHQAQSATTANSAQSADLSLALPSGETITYSLQAQRLQRIVRNGDDVRHRQMYRLPMLSTAAWRVADDRPASLVTLELRMRPSGRPVAGTVARTHRVLAAVELLKPALPTPEAVGESDDSL